MEEASPQDPQPSAVAMQADAAEDPPPPRETQKMIHTRSCNRREVCSCFLRLQSAYFQMNLVTKRKKKKQAAASSDDDDAKCDDGSGAVTFTAAAAGVDSQQENDISDEKSSTATPSKKKRRVFYRAVKNLQLLDIEAKQLVAMFLEPAELAMLSSVSRTMRSEVETIAERGSRAFVSAPSRTDMVLKEEKSQSESWARYLHVQMNCVYRLLVYYTGYKTGQMRRDFAHWTFGVVEIDPNDPSLAILPNTWKFHEHEPWQHKRANGKGGEWLLRPAYKRGRAPKVFGRQVKEWASSLRPGSFVAVAYQNVGSDEPAWWEAQVWYVWRAKGQADPGVVFDPQSNTTMEIQPDDLLEHFKQNPLHVIDVCSTPRKVCGSCARGDKSFFHCHVERGHPMR